MPNGGPSGKGKSNPETFFKPDGGRSEALGEDHCGRLKDRNKMERRLNGIQARHSSVRDMYEVALRDTPEGVRLFWQVKEDRRDRRKSIGSLCQEPIATGVGFTCAKAPNPA